MRITVTEKGRKAGVAWPPSMPYNPNESRMSVLVFCMSRGYATVEPESDEERAALEALLNKHMQGHRGLPPG